MKNLEKTIGLMILIICGFTGIGRLSAVNISFDLTRLSFAQYLITGPGGFRSSQPNSGVRTVNLPANGAYELRVEMPAGSEVFRVQFQMSSNKVQPTVLWKDGNGSMSGGGFINIGTRRFCATTNTRLTLYPMVFRINTTEVDLTHLNPIEGNAGARVGTDRQYNLFPGDYSIASSTGDVLTSSRIDFQLRIDSTLDTVVFCRNNTSQPYVAMHQDYFQRVSPNGLKLIGFPVEISLVPLTGLTATLTRSTLPANSIKSGLSSTAKLLPGLYELKMTETETGKLLGSYNVQVEATERALSPVINWLPQGSGVSRPVTSAEVGIMRSAITVISTGNVQPNLQNLVGTINYAMLDARLDGAYYVTQSGVLKFKHLERYNVYRPPTSPQALLDVTIYDAQHRTVNVNYASLPNPPYVKYGMNFFELPLPSNNFQQGAYYILEVKDFKGDPTYLRFRYE